MTIIIKNYKESHPDDKYIAEFDVYDPESTGIDRHIKLYQSKRGVHFLSFPSKMITQEDGSQKYEKHRELSPERQKKYENAILDELTPFVRGGIVKGTERI